MSVISLGKHRAKRKGPLIHSELLHRAFDRFEDDDCIHVLDVGVGVPDTVEFLTQFRCKVYFLDLAEGLNDDAETDTYANAFSSYHAVLFDVCLFWDLLHRLTGTQLTALSAALAPHIFSDTKMHSICNLSEVDGMWDYRIRGIDQLEKIPGRSRNYQEWSHSNFAQQFSCAHTIADRLSHDGCLEMLLQTE